MPLCVFWVHSSAPVNESLVGCKCSVILTNIMQTNLVKLVRVRYIGQVRCYCNKQPQDYISPPTKVWQYITNKFTKFVTHYENKLEKNVPKAFNVYKTLKCVRFIASDTKDYFTVSMEMWGGRELHTFTRRELEIYQEMPRDMPKIIGLLFLAAIPFIGNFLVAIGYWFPRTLFTHHLWNDQQKVEFNQHFHTHRLSQYHHVLNAVEKQTRRHLTGEKLDNMKQILHKLEYSNHPTSEDLLKVRQNFDTFPFSLDSMPTFYLRHVAKSCGFSRSRQKLLHDGLLLLHMDRAMVREGIDQLTESELCHVCIKRGLNPYGLSKEERVDFLKTWTEISLELDETSVSLLLHCPTFLTYNKDSNIRIMKGKKYGWKHQPAEQLDNS